MPKQRVVRELENPFSTGENFAELFKKTVINAPVEGTVIKGTILSIVKDNILVDIGFKTEGRISIKEFPFSERENVNVGDTVEVFLERTENHRSEAVISRERAVREEAWSNLEKLHADEKQVDGMISSRVKGGFTVDLDGAIAFLPGSQVDVRPVKDISPLMNIVQPFMILKMDRRRGNIVVSRRAILEESRSAERAEALSGIEEGAILEGVVKNITDYGAFIDLGVIDGLLHVTDISWKRISHPSEILKLGETIKAKVIKFDKESQRISLGVKQMEESPWEIAKDKYTIGSRHNGHVTNITDYGAFVELLPGIEGLVHISEMSWTKKNLHPNKIVSISEEVEVEVLSIDSSKHRLSLGMKQCTENPWKAFEKEYESGTQLDGEVKSIADFGLFVSFGKDADGLVHLSDLTWDDNPEEVLKDYKKGDKVKVVVLDINSEKERIALGIKQIDGDPFKKAVGGLNRGDVSTFTVSEVNDGGVEVEVSDGIKAFIKKGDISRDRVECRPDRFSVGDRIDAKVTGIDAENRTVRLSIKAMEIDDQKKAIAEFGSTDSGATLGGILGVALDTAKKEKEAKEEDKSS